MQIKPGFRQAVLSALVFGGILFALASVDARVGQRVEGMVSGGGAMSFLHDTGRALVNAVQQQSIDGAPLMIFAVAGALLFVFMLRA